MDKIVVAFIIRTTVFLLNYISFFFLTFIVCEIIAVVFIAITNTSLEKTAIMILSNTPTLNLWGTNTFSLGTKEIMQFFTFWSFALMIGFNIINQFFKIKINLVFNLIIISVLHLLAVLRAGNIFPTILIFYLLSFLSYFIYKFITILSGIILDLNKRITV